MQYDKYDLFDHYAVGVESVCTSYRGLRPTATIWTPLRGLRTNKYIKMVEFHSTNGYHTEEYRGSIAWGEEQK